MGAGESWKDNWIKRVKSTPMSQISFCQECKGLFPKSSLLFSSFFLLSSVLFMNKIKEVEKRWSQGGLFCCAISFPVFFFKVLLALPSLPHVCLSSCSTQALLTPVREFRAPANVLSVSCTCRETGIK